MLVAVANTDGLQPAPLVGAVDDGQGRHLDADDGRDLGRRERFLGSGEKACQLLAVAVGVERELFDQGVQVAGWPASFTLAEAFAAAAILGVGGAVARSLTAG